jgi:hypothetical protein
MHLRRVLLLTGLLALLLPAAGTLLAQGVTTAGINGIVLDKTGEPLIGATVVAVHEPSGSKFGTTTRTDGRFNLQNLRVGGPYTVTVSYIGYAAKRYGDITLRLSQNMHLEFSLEEKTVEVGAVDVVGERNPVLSANRTGAAVNVPREIIERVPNVSRSFTDFQKLSPQFVGNSAAGRNNRFNNIQIDGTQYNDLFGLGSSGTPGGQASTTPISLDALQEFQVVVAPYDVRQNGFTGGGVNAITRSGTNSYAGSVFGYFRNQDFVGLSPDTNRQKFGAFQEYQTGFRVGGPVLKDNLFFFATGEITDRTQPTDILFTKNGSTGYNVSTIPYDSVARFASILRNQYGYDPGAFDNVDLERRSVKLFLRLDYNLASNHRLTLRHNYVDANDDNLPRTLTRFFFENSNYVFNNTTHSTVLQLSSMFGNAMSNELILGYTRIRDMRETVGAPFPFIRIKFGAKGDLYAGTENYSIANKLDQDIFEITDNLTYFMGDHVFTVGTHNELFGFENLYIRDLYGNYEFNSLTDFEAGRPSRYTVSYSLTGDARQSAKFSAIQFGFYAQDEWTVVPALKLTGGVRVDIPTFPDTPTRNAKIDSTFGSMGVGTDIIPSGNLLFSPRLGFNWDVTGSREIQLRGGAGIFSGRIAYVWLSNQYGNTGVEFGRIDVSSRPAGFFTGSWADPPRAGLSTVTTSEVNLTDPDFSMPQLARMNLALDYQLPLGFVATVEGIYSKTLNDILYQDINIAPSQGTLAGDGRPVYGTYSTSTNRFSVSKVNPAFTNVIYMTNTDQGYQYSITAQVQRQVLDGLTASAAYTYGESKDVNSVLSSQAYSQWRYNHVPGDPNNPPLSWSAFDIRHRMFVAAAYRHEFFDGAGTTVSLFLNGQSGAPFSYVYDGDVNGDGQTENDLIYVPRDADDIILTSNNYDRLNQFIEGDDALSESRGKIFDRMGARVPWQTYLDVRFAQEIPIPTLAGHRFELTVDILNVLNLLDGDWGYSKFVDQQRYRLLSFQGLDAATQKPKFSFNDAKMDPYDISSLASRWQMQIGLRYTF